MSDSPGEVPGVGEPPRYVRFLQHLVAEGGYGLDESHALVGVKEWREAEVVGALLRNVKERAPDAVVGRIFTAVNQAGLVVLVGEAGEPDEEDDDDLFIPETTSDGASNGTEISSAAAERAPRRRVLTDCHISACTLDQPVNLGAPDGRNARAVFLVMVPEVDFTATWAEGLGRFECLRTIKTAFQRFAARGTFLKTVYADERNLETTTARQKFADLLSKSGDGDEGEGEGKDAELGKSSGRMSSKARATNRPTSPKMSTGTSSMARSILTPSTKTTKLRPADLVDALRTSVDIWADHEQRRLLLLADETERSTDVTSMYQWTGRLCGGVIDDVTNRWAPLFYSDWIDGISVKTVSASLLMFFNCLAPCIAFGALTAISTDNKMGTMEYLVAQSVAGVVWSIFAGQPEIVLRTTGPSTVFLIELAKACERDGYPFITALAWTGIWSAMFMIAIACLDACTLMLRNCTRFTQEIFGLFVSAIFIQSGGSALVSYFESDEYDLSQALFSLLLGLLTLQLGLWALQVRTSPFLFPTMRELTADFGVAAAIAVGTLTAWGSGVRGMEMLNMASKIEPADGRGSWVVDLYDGPAHLKWLAIVPALLLTALMYVEMNISSLLANKPENKLIKGPAHHQNFLVMALITLVFALFGLPPMTGSLPHSPQFIRALSDVEEITVGGETRTNVIWVRENRLAPLLVHVLMSLTIVMAPVLREIPMAVLYGLFLYMGITGLATSQLWTRMKMIAMDPRLLPPTHYVRKVPLTRVHAFTLVQMCCCAVLLVVRQTPAALFFPLFLGALMPLRYMLTHEGVSLFTPEMLKMLDMIAEGSNAETAADIGRKEDEDHLTIRGKVTDFEGSVQGGARRRSNWSSRRNSVMLDLAEVGPAINGAELLVERGEGSEPKSPKYT
jgi:solute carrier family 4 (anion exchanger), member 1